MSNLTTMSYGSYNFSPVPFIELSQEIIQNKDGRVGTKYHIKLDGTLSTSPTLAGGIINIITLQNTLKNAFSQDGLKFIVSCGGTPLLICYPKIIAPISFPASNNNWIYTSPYTIELEFEDYCGETHTPYVEQSSENWTVEFIEDQPKYKLELSGVASGSQASGYYYGQDCNYLMLKVSHNLNAIGQRHYSNISGTGTGLGITGILVKEAWEYAKDWCINRLGFDSGVVQDSGILNMNITGVGGVASYYPYNHIRGISRSETQGSYSVDESWLVALSGSGETYSGALRATEDFTVDVIQHAEDDLTECNVQGSIQGWESRNYGTTPGDFIITETKIQSAEAYWDVIKLRLLSRAQLYAESISSRKINILPLTKTVAYLPSKGMVTYNYSYDDRPGVRFISGALAENISMEHNLATEVVASLPIIGRSAGAIVQSMNTYTNPTLTFSIEVTMPRSTGTGLVGFMDGIPRTQVNSFLCQVQSDLTGNWESVHIIENKESWVPPKYNRNISWLYTICGSGSGTIMTGVCP